MGSILIMAGGTGGHIFPALAVAKYLQATGSQVLWLGSPQGLETRLVPEHGFTLEIIKISGLRSTGIMRKLKAPFQVTGAVLQAINIIRRYRPIAALGMGGFASGPGGLAAWMLGVPLIIHEQNKIPGFTNKSLSRLATRVFQAFPDTFPTATRAITCGNPVREEIAALPPPQQRWEQRTGALRLLVLGGSQGAKALNDTVPAALNLIPINLRPQVRHQTGAANLNATALAYREQSVEAEVTAFIDNMAEAYGWADLVIARAGALTLSELAAAGLGSLLVPFPHAVDDHQTQNAHWLVQAGAAKLLPQQDLTAQLLAATVLPFAENRIRALDLAQAARSQAQIAATQTIAQGCLDVTLRT